MNLSTALTLIVVAMNGANQATATYTLVNGTDTGFCADTKDQDYSVIASENIGYDPITDTCNTPFANHTYALAFCSNWCSVDLPPSHNALEIVRSSSNGCWGCWCRFDDPMFTPKNITLYQNPETSFGFVRGSGTGPISRTIPDVSDRNFTETCYRYAAPSSQPSDSPIEGPSLLPSASPSAGPLNKSSLSPSASPSARPSNAASKSAKTAKNNSPTQTKSGKAKSTKTNSAKRG